MSEGAEQHTQPAWPTTVATMYAIVSVCPLPAQVRGSPRRGHSDCAGRAQDNRAPPAGGCPVLALARSGTHAQLDRSSSLGLFANWSLQFVPEHALRCLLVSSSAGSAVSSLISRSIAPLLRPPAQVYEAKPQPTDHKAPSEEAMMKFLQ